MNEPIIPEDERTRHLETLQGAWDDVSQICDRKVRFGGLPFEEWAGPGYAVAALFDPFVLTADLAPSIVHLDVPEGAACPKGLSAGSTRGSQKERISFRVNAARQPELHLPAIWGGVTYRALRATAPWRTLADIAELPGLVVSPGCAVFAFNPLRVIHRHLNMADPRTTRDLMDLLVMAILGASGADADLDDQDLRRDFHALGLSTFLVAQMHRAVGKVWDVKHIEPELRLAAKACIAGDLTQARERLGASFRVLEEARRQLAGKPVYHVVMPHGGILFDGEGYAEYDWPEASARVLNLYLDWADRFGYKFAPDIGAGTLEAFDKLHPRTIKRLGKAWEAGRVEFVNGTYSQPYAQLWPMWDQDKQFEQGLKVFDRLFGRRPTVYAAQEIALHPALPDLLVKHGFKQAIHRAQNLGLAPLETVPFIEWMSPAGSSIRALPSHPLRGERRGGNTWRHLPILLTSARNDGVPFVSFTSLMDQSFIDLYAEEIVRSHAYAPVWGEFLTPTEFFDRTASFPAERRVYTLDDYDYALDLVGNTIHAHETGGYSSEQAFLFAEGRRLRALEQTGRLDEDSLRRFLNQQAHDTYIIPYFAQGAFMDKSVADYAGPRYVCSSEGPRGYTRAIRDAAGYPERFRDCAPAAAEPCVIRGGVIAVGPVAFKVDLKSGAVIRIGPQACRLGCVTFDGKALVIAGVERLPDRLRLTGNLSGFGTVTLAYFIAGRRLFCEVSIASNPLRVARDAQCWERCVSLEHAKPAGAEVWRRVSGVVQPTRREAFHSLDVVELRRGGETRVLGHGGNIFFRQTPTTLSNRLWCHDEFCDCFWWSVALDGAMGSDGGQGA
jgi:hypothetical protein